MRTQRKFLAWMMTFFLLASVIPTAAMANGEDGTMPLEDVPADITEVTITEEDMEGEDATAIAAAIFRLTITELNSITALKVTTGEGAYLSPEDNMYIKENFTSLEYLDESACTCSTRKLTSVYLTNYGSGNMNGGYLEDIEYEEFGGLSSFESLKTLLIPNTAQVINAYTLSTRGGGINNTGLTSLSIPDSVVLLENGSCSGLTSFTGDLIIPDSVIIVGNNAFGVGTTAIPCGTLTIGNSVKTMNRNAFAGRKFSGNLVIPDSVYRIDSGVFVAGAFENGTWTIGKGPISIGDSLGNICSGNSGTLTILSQWRIDTGSFKGNTFDKVIFEEGIVTTPNQIIASSANVTEVVLPSTIKYIGADQYGNSFGSCTALKTINFPEGLLEIRPSSFSDCDALTSAVLPSTLTTLGASAFEDSGIVGAYIPASVTSIEKRVFQDIPEGSVIYMANDALLSMMTTSDSAWDNKYNASNTALAVTNGGTFAPDTEFESGKLAAPAKIGYIFEGWYADKDFSGDAVTAPAAGQTYYAKWEECTHTTWNPATCTEPRTCSVCGMTEGTALGHSFTNYIYNNDATYDADGTKTAACDRGCGATDTVTAEGTQLIRASSGGGSGSSGYTVSVDSGKHGSVTVSPKSASKGTTVTITVKPDKGCELDDLTVTDRDDDELKLTKKSDTKYTFTMPASKVEVEATFIKIEEAPEQTFTDVPDGYWAEDAIAWASENGYMNGSTAATFNPEGTVSRQQLWMILARLSGYNPATMAEAKSWAVDNGISDGTAPGGSVSRQQLVTILYRYAVRMGYKTSGSADLTAYPDHASVAAYAKDAMSWSVANSIVGGTTQGTLNPAGTATRAQFAVILQRFVEHVM